MTTHETSPASPLLSAADTYEMDEPRHGAFVEFVAPESAAARAGLQVGDRLETAAGAPLRDIIDWRWQADGPCVAVTGVHPDGTAFSTELTRAAGEEWGFEFTSLLFDGIRRCSNACPFCFMQQLPKGLRPSLSIRDDDYRLSFLQGNFVTLTNLGPTDIERIVEQHLSPLCVSFHASEPSVREQLIGCNASRGLENFVTLAEAGIELNVQIVLVPGVNDGAHLAATVQWLRTYHDAVASVGIVPVAYTRMTPEAQCRSYDDQLAAAKIIEQVQHYQFEERAAHERTWIHLADEFYIKAQAPMPQEEWYDGFPQYENGIGIVWDFVDDIKEHFVEFEHLVGHIPAGSDAVTIVCGELPTDTFVGALTALQAGGRIRLLPVRNTFFGGNVDVTGLLVGADIARAIAYDSAHLAHSTVYLVPNQIFNADGLALDDYTAERIADEAGAPVVFYEPRVPALMQAIKGAL